MTGRRIVLSTPRRISCHLFDGASDKASREIDPGLVTAGQMLLQRARFREDEEGFDNAMAQIARSVLTTPDIRHVAVDVMNHLGESVEQRFSSWSDYEELLSVMFELQPFAAMDAIFSGTDTNPDSAFLVGWGNQRTNPADKMSSEALTTWCRQQGNGDRHDRAARIVTYSKPAKGEGLEWSDQAIALLTTAPAPERVIAVFAQRMRQGFWSGSRAAVMGANAQLLDKLGTLVPASALSSATTEKARLVRESTEELQRETEEARVRDERFE